MTKLFKALGATFLAAGLVVAGVVAPVNAAPLSGATVTSSATIGTSGTNATSIVITATSVSGSPANMFNVLLPAGWSFVSTGNCTGTISVTGFTPATCAKYNFARGFLTVQMGQSTFTAGQTVVVTIDPGAVNVASGRDFSIDFADSAQSGASVDGGTATLAGGVSNSTVTFDANGGSGSMSTQSSSSAITLTPNAFTRTNYNFAGWNTAADGSGTAYADAESFPFTSSATLYAQWTPTLANTGMSDVTWQMGEITLALMGFGILLFIRQRKRNA